MSKFAVLAVLVSATAFGQPAQNKGLIGHSMDKASGAGYYGMSGCGLGSVLFGESENRGGQILSATTNDIYSTNTFAMSSGTSNCTPEANAHAAQMKKNVEMFVSANRAALANDVVKSNGETIVTVANIMGCDDYVYMGTKLQSRYETIFASKDDIVVADTMYDTLTSDRYLIENCKL